MNRKKTGLNILLGVTGSVAAVKLPELARLINGDEDLDANLRIVLTENSKKFIDPIVLQDLASEMIIYDDASDWSVSEAAFLIFSVPIIKSREISLSDVVQVRR